MKIYIYKTYYNSNSSMLPKRQNKTAQNFYISSPSSKSKPAPFPGYPYTLYPVALNPKPLQQIQANSLQNNSCINPRSLNLSNQRTVYTSYQQTRHGKQRSMDSKSNNNPGLINIGRKINYNRYDNDQLYGEAEAIRKFGMNYRRKLMAKFQNQHKYNLYRNRMVISKGNDGLDHERQIKNWYQQRNQGLHEMLIEYMKKLQQKLSQNKQINKSDRQNLFNQMNIVWDEEIQEKLKKCFDT